MLFSVLNNNNNKKKTKKSQIVLSQIIIRNATLGLYIQNQKENIGSWTIWLFLAY